MPESRANGATTTSGESGSGGGEKSIFSSLAQGVGIFLIMQFVVTQFFGNKSSTSSESGAVVGKANYNFAERPEVSTIANYSHVPNSIAPLWPDDSTLDLKIYVSSVIQPFGSKGELVVDEKNIKMRDYKDVRDIATTIKIPSEVQNNGTLWAHFLLGLSGSQLDPTHKNFDPHQASHFYRPLNHYLPKKKVRKLKNLLDKAEGDEEAPEEPKGVQIGSFYHSNFTVAIIPDTGIQNWRSMHPALRKNIVLEPTGARDETGQNGWYYPVIFLNTFWQLRSHMTELNDTVKEVPLNIQLKNFQSWKYSLMASMDQSMKESQMQAASGTPMPGGGDGSEMEKFKEILLDTNSYLLATTFFVSILHMIFEGLAFKSDISHWRKKKDNIGTSVRTIVANVFMQLIIFLYLLDNSEGTSWMILAGQGFGILLEAWKITKTVNVVVRSPEPGSKWGFLPYVVIFEDKHKLSDVEKKTQEYDEIAFRYLYIVAVPLLLAYAAYSLVYETHKSWYSFVIETLVGSVYAYGFLMMVPSLYINYRLKSVAHMPSKTMTYKFLNTFIDDLFAFTIRMPTLHRLATLRDDVIFFVWLYQKWQYKVDYTRVNEFGQGGESDDEGEGEGKEKKDGNGKVLEQDVKALKPSAPSASASGREEKVGGKKRK
jgi:Cleft lip and palate transmembrane protein 1 (CLPTM1)